MERDLAAWIERCREAEIDDEIVGSMWGAGGITPPPVTHPPITRLPLERARALAAAGGGDPAAASRLRREAVEWLRHPHPRASASTRREMARLRAELEAMLERREDSAQD